MTRPATRPLLVAVGLAVAAALGLGAATPDAAAPRAPPSGTGFTADAPGVLGLPATWRALPALDQAAAAILDEAGAGGDHGGMAIAVRGFGDPATGTFAVAGEARCLTRCNGGAVMSGLRSALDEAVRSESLVATEIAQSGSAAGVTLTAALRVPGSGATEDRRAELTGRLRAVIGVTTDEAMPPLRAVACFYNAREAAASRTLCEAIVARLEIAR